ncbi:hypothetical protein Tcan_02257, partial [Toxocara canis]
KFSNTASRPDSQFVASTPDRRKPSEFAENGAPLSPIPRMHSLEGSEEGYQSARTSAVKKLSLTDVFEAFSEDERHADNSDIISTGYILLPSCLVAKIFLVLVFG